MIETANYSPKYVYDQPMFMVTVNTIIIDENGVLVVHNGIHANTNAPEGESRFPGGPVMAGKETVQSAAIRHIKDQIGMVVEKEALIPVDFRSDPERSESGNIVEIGFVILLKQSHLHHAKWFEVDFSEKKVILDDTCSLSKDSEIFLERAIDVALMIKEM